MDMHPISDRFLVLDRVARSQRRVARLATLAGVAFACDLASLTLVDTSLVTWALVQAGLAVVLIVLTVAVGMSGAGPRRAPPPTIGRHRDAVLVPSFAPVLVPAQAR